MEKNKKNKKYLLIFLFLFGSLVLCTSLFNIYFNPYSTFSDYQFESKKVYSDRVAKFKKIESLESKPEGYVLGSSNSMRMLPDHLEQETGLSFFNYGVFHARVEDFWAISNVLISDLNAEPKLILLCLDDWNFADEPPPSDELFLGAEKRLAYKDVYAKYLDDFSEIKQNWFQFKASINIDQSLGSLSVLRAQIDSADSWEKTIPDISETFFDDGVRKRYGILGRDDDITEEVEKGELDVSAQLEKTHLDWKKYPVTKDGILSNSHEVFENFSMRRLKLFYRTLKLLEGNDCKVILNVMPLQPYYKKLVLDATNYEERMLNFNKYLSWLNLHLSNIVLIQDNSDISDFSGFENHFFDHIHPSSVNSSLMIDRIFNTKEF
jgi:hypothetical protein